MIVVALALMLITTWVDQDWQPPAAVACTEPGHLATDMSDNDEWLAVAEGSLEPGASFEVTQPRKTCMEEPVRIGWRWLGNGKPPTGLTLTIFAPGGVGRVDFTEVVATKAGKPVWVHQCSQLSGPESFGFYVFRLTNTGPTTVANLRFGAAIKTAETTGEQCDAPALGWPTWLWQLGI